MSAPPHVTARAPHLAGAARGGRVWRFGSHVSTDVITPGRMNISTDDAELAQGCFAEVRPELRAQAQPGDLIVADANFGCGSSRESAARALKALGLVVVAPSYGSIFYRNAVNIGLPVYVAEGALTGVADGATATLTNDGMRIGNLVIPLSGASGFLAGIVAAGGIVPYVSQNGGLTP